MSLRKASAMVTKHRIEIHRFQAKKRLVSFLVADEKNLMKKNLPRLNPRWIPWWPGKFADIDLTPVSVEKLQKFLCDFTSASRGSILGR